MSPEPFIYPIIDTTVCAARGLDPVALAEACLRGGARLLQLRDKDGGTGRLVALADRIIGAAHRAGGRVLINDRADVARLSRADGVHVGQDDLPVRAVRAVVGRHAIIGLSTHDRAQVDAALATDADYVAVGPIYATGTKDTGYEPRGLDLIAYAAGKGKPVVAIGGITLDRAATVAAAGASGLAVVTDILVGDDVEARVAAFVRRLPGLPFNV